MTVHNNFNLAHCLCSILRARHGLTSLRPQQEQQTEKMKGKAPENNEGAKPSGEKVKEKTKEPIPSDKKN